MADIMRTLPILLIFRFDVALGLWKCEDKEKCFNCEELQEEFVEIIRVPKRTIVNITSDIGTSDTTDLQKKLMAKYYDDFHAEFAETFGLRSDVEFVMPYVGPTVKTTTQWTVDPAGALFAKLRAKCKFGCKRLNMSDEIVCANSGYWGCPKHHTISGIGKFPLPNPDVGSCQAEDYYVYLGVEINNKLNSHIKVAKRRPPYGITWSTVTNLLNSRKVDDEMLKQIRHKLLIKFSENGFVPSPTTGHNWGFNFPEFGLHEQDKTDSEIDVEGGHAAQLYTIVGVCGEYTIHTGLLLPRMYKMYGQPECVSFYGAKTKSISNCDFCKEMKCVKGKQPPIWDHDG